MPSSGTIDVVRRDDLLLTFVITDEAGTPVEISQDQVTFTVKATAEEADPDAKIKMLVLIPPASTPVGQVQYQLSAVDTDLPSGKYIFGLQWVRLITANAETVTVMKGDFNVEQDVTHLIT